MRSVLVVVSSILVLARPAAAQDLFRAEIFAGYLYVHLSGPQASANLNGGTASASVALGKWFGVVGDFGAYGGSHLTLKSTGASIDADSKYITYVFGPRARVNRSKVSAYAQALFGGVHRGDITSNTGSVISPSQNAFAMTTGGGFDIAVSRHIAVRPAQAEYLLTKFTNTGSTRQDDFRYAAGIVFH